MTFSIMQCSVAYILYCTYNVQFKIERLTLIVFVYQKALKLALNTSFSTKKALFNLQYAHTYSKCNFIPV